MSGEQKQIFEVSAPAAPSGDAPFISATTAPKSFVFKPGLVFPNNGPVQQNVYTSPNSSGQNGLLALQAVLTGTGLFPAIPLPSSHIELDFSLTGNIFNATAAINFGANVELSGVPSPVSAGQPTLAMHAFQLSAPASIHDVQISATGAGPVFTSNPSDLTLSGRASLVGALFYTIPTGGNYFITLKDRATLGTGTTIVHVSTGASVAVSLEDFATLGANAFSFAGTGALGILASPLATIDPSYFSNPAVTVRVLPNQGSYLFVPGGSYLPPQRLNTEPLLISGVDAGSPVPIIYFDFSSSADAYSTISPLINLGTNGTWIGVFDQVTGVYPTLTVTGQVVTAPIEISDMHVHCTFVGDAFSANPTEFTISGTTTIVSDPSALLYGVSGTPASKLTLRDSSSLGDGTNPVIQVFAIGVLSVLLEGQSVLRANSIAITPGGLVTITVAPGAAVDDSFVGASGFTIINLNLRSPIAIGNLGAQATNTGAITIGDGSVSNGTNAMCLGASCFSSGSSTIATGIGDANTHDGSLGHSSGGGVSGIVEYAANVVSNATVAFSNISPTCFVTEADKTYSGSFRIVATQDAGAGTPGLWVYDVLFRNIGGTVTIFNTVLRSTVGEQNGNGWTFTFGVSGAQLTLSITGTVAQTVHASARMDWVEVNNS